MEVSKSIFKRQADFLEKNGKYLLQFTIFYCILEHCNIKCTLRKKEKTRGEKPDKL